MTRVLLFGAGSIGVVYLHIMRRGGANVTAICRSNYTAAKQNGFIVKSKKLGDAQIRPGILRTPIEAKGNWDFIVVCNKAMPNSRPSTAQLIKPAVSPSTAIVLLQNGIAIEEDYALEFPDNPIISGVVYMAATQTEPGVVSHTYKEVEPLYVGTFPANAPAAHKKSARQFADLVRNGGGTVEVCDDIQPQRWSKLIVNASWNPICALTRSRDVPFIRSSPGAIDLVQSVMFEVMSIAQAVGYKKEINEETVEYQIARPKARDLPGVEPSMMADALAGRSMEVEAILGNTLRIGRDHGVETPLLNALYVLAKALDDSFARERHSSEASTNRSQKQDGTHPDINGVE